MSLRTTMRKISTVKIDNRINKKSAWQRIEKKKRSCLKHLVNQCWVKILTMNEIFDLTIKFEKNFVKFDVIDDFVTWNAKII